MVRILHLLAPSLPTGTAKQLHSIAGSLLLDGMESNFCSLESNGQRKRILTDVLTAADDGSSWTRQRVNSRNLEGVPDVGLNETSSQSDINLPLRSVASSKLAETPLMFCRYGNHFDPTFVIRCAKAIRDAKPQIVHLWGQHPVAPMRIALRMAGVRNSVLSIRSSDEVSNSQIAPNATVLVNSEWLKAELPLEPRVLVAKNLPPSAASSVLSPIHRELGLEPGTKFILAMGDLVQKKRLRDLIWALDLLRVLRPDVHLLVAGDGCERESLRRFADNVVSASAVHFLGHRHDTGNLLRQSLCLWQTSEDEGCSNAVAQALLAEKPVVASDIPAHTFLLGKGEFGSLAPLGACAEIARITNLLMRDVEKNREKAKRGRLFVESEFGTSDAIETHRSVYGEMFATPSAA